MNTTDLLPFVFGAFGAGLLALITPCVFPMIPITLAFFTKQATLDDGSGKVDQGGVVKLATLYSLGIVIAFTALGGIAAATIGAAGAQRFAANPWTNLAFAILFFIFGLALLEIFELRLPAKLQNLAAPTMGGAGGRKTGGALGVLGLGLTFVIAAFTCTAPFIGTVLVAAAQAKTGNDWVRPILGMAVFSSALALPFFLLSLFPSLLARLPKSGAWLTTVKGAMGFLELAAALKFLSNADLTLHTNLLTRPLMLALTGLIFLAGALWLAGRLQIGWSTPTGKPTPMRLLWTSAFAVAGLYMLYGLTGRPLTGALEAYLPPEELFAKPGTSANVLASANGGTATTAAAVESPVFVNDLEGAKAEAKRTNRPIFVDFTAISCTNCRAMEKNVFPKPDVQSQFKNYVRLILWTDGYQPGKSKPLREQLKDGEQWQKFQEENYATVTLPLYGVLDSDAKPLQDAATNKPIQFAYDEDATKFAAFLAQGQTAFGSASGTATVAQNSNTDGEAGGVEAGKEFVNDIEGALAHAKRTNQLVFVDFTGYSCTNCRWMEKNIFPNPEVAANLNKFVRLVLYTDEYTKRDPKTKKRLGETYQDFQEKYYDTVATPCYGVLTADGLPVRDTATGKPIMIEYDTNPQNFVNFLARAQAAGTAAHVVQR